MDKKLKSNLVTGAILIAVGILFTLQNFNILSFRYVRDFWPFILVAFGVPKLLQYPSPGVFVEGLWLVFLGFWLYISMEHTFGFGFSRSWPLVIVMAGLSVIVKNALKNMNKKTAEESYGE